MTEVSVVMPCLNEEKTVGICVEKCLKVFKENNIDGEVIVVDNGSTDNSAEVARKAGARVVFEERKGKGYAMQKGFGEVKGKYIIVGDSDGQHDFSEIPNFLKLLTNDHYDFVNGTRFKGKIVHGATRWLHRYIGNPVLTKIFNISFNTNISDMTSGFFGFRKDILERIELKTAEFEFESEIKAKIAKKNLKIGEVPITYYPREGKTKLHSFRDGWRHLRFILLFAPNWLFLVPGFSFLLIGLFLIFSILNGPLIIGNMQFDIHPMIFGSFLTIIGLQIITFGLQSKIYSRAIGFENESKTLKFVDKYFTLERGILIGFIIFLIGLGILIYIFNLWLIAGFVHQVKLMIVGMTLTVLGIQIIFSSWFLSLIGIEKR